MHPFNIRTILAPTDLTDSSLPALRYARQLAERYFARLVVLYTDPIVYGIDFGGTGTAFYQSTPENQALLSSEVRRHADPVMGTLPYQVATRIGQPAGAIVGVAREERADLIVVGRHVRKAWERVLYGSVSESILHRSTCPVLIVSEEVLESVPGSITHVLCPVNFSDVARSAVSVATGVADAFGARLSIVHVLEDDDVTSEEMDAKNVASWLGEDAAASMSYETVVAHGNPAERVLDCAEHVGADLLVLGAQHKIFRDATVLGATTERVMQFAHCPLLIVPRHKVPGAQAAKEKAVPAPAGVLSR